MAEACGVEENVSALQSLLPPPKRKPICSLFGDVLWAMICIFFGLGFWASWTRYVLVLPLLVLLFCFLAATNLTLLFKFLLCSFCFRISESVVVGQLWHHDGLGGFFLSQRVV